MILEIIQETLYSGMLAFVLFAVFFPFAGLLLGELVRVALPYLFGGGVVTALLLLTSSLGETWWAILLFAPTWAMLVSFVRERRSKEKETPFPWNKGHYRAALSVLSLRFLRP